MLFKKKSSNSGGDSLTAGDALDMEEHEDLAIENSKRKGSSKASSFKDTIKRIFIGLFIILASIGVFFLGQYLGSGEKVTVLHGATINAENNNKLVYVSGTPEASKMEDPLFKVSSEGLSLERVVEMYQWVGQDGQYSKEWSQQLVKIEDPSAISKGQVNPAKMPLISEKWDTEKVMLGDFALSENLVARQFVPSQLYVGEKEYNNLNDEGRKAFKLSKDGYFFFGLDPKNPRIGDLRITYKYSSTGPVTVIAKQAGNSLEPFLGNGGPIAVIRGGKVPLDDMLQDVDLGGDSIILWSARGISIVMIIMGIFVVKGRKKKKQDDQFEDEYLYEEEPVSAEQPVVQEDEATEEEYIAEQEHYNTEVQQEEFGQEEAQMEEQAEEVAEMPEIPVSPAIENEAFVQDTQAGFDQGGSHDNKMGLGLPQLEGSEQMVSPAPLEFSSEIPPEQNDDHSVTAQLQQFGIISDEKSGDGHVQDNGDYINTAPIASENTYDLDFSAAPVPESTLQEQEAPVMDMEQTTQPPYAAEEEIPAGIEFLSEDLLGGNNKAEDATQVAPDPVNRGTESKEEVSFASEVNLSIPEGVEVLYEGDMAEEGHNVEKNISVSEEPGVLQPPLPPEVETPDVQAPTSPSADEVDTYEEVSMESEDAFELGYVDEEILPSPPVSEDTLQTASIESEEISTLADDHLEIDNSDDELLPPPPPPPSSYESYDDLSEAMPEEDEDEYKDEYEDKDSSPLPPEPDFDKLFGHEEHIEEEALEAEPKIDGTVSQEVKAEFDLPGIPEDFDPSVEMPSYEPEEGSEEDGQSGESNNTSNSNLDSVDTGEELHDPFGADDPFAINEAAKK